MPSAVSLLIFIVILIITLPVALVAQTSATDGKTPTGLAPGAPAGSYSLGGFDNVNLFNGNLNVALPLINVLGRGDSSYTVTLPIEQRWRVVTGTFDLGDSVIYYSAPEANWWTGLRPGYGPGVIQARGVASGPMGGCAGSEWYVATMTRLTFTAPDGTEYELKDRDYDGRPMQSAGCYAATPARGTVFISSDGSAITFESDFPITDDHYTPGPLIYGVTGYLKFPNGVIYRVVQGLVTSIRDRNGNQLSFMYGTNPTNQTTYQKVIEIKDSLNRLVSISYGDNVSVFYDTLSFKGFGGAARTLRVWHNTLGNTLRTTQPGDATVPQTQQQLFPEITAYNTQTFNPIVVSSVELPNGQHYDFRYDKYGELARVIFPTGGAIEYDHTPTSGIICQGICDGGAQIYRRVVERRVYPNGTTLEGKTRFSATVVSSNSVIQVDRLNASDALLARSKHYLYGDAAPSLYLPSLYLAPWKEGKEYQTEQIKEDGSTVLYRTTHTWQQRASVSWWPLGWQGTSQNDAPPNDPRVIETVTTLVDTNQVSKQTFGYDDTVPFNNRNNVKEYGFGIGTPGALLRETQTTYLTSSTYTGGNVHLRRVPAQISIYDGGGTERARTVFEYDNYTMEGADCAHSFHCALLLRSNISGLDPLFSSSYTTRGNRTALHRYILGGGTATPVSIYSQFDVAGNVVRGIDPRSTSSNIIAATIEYDDRFGTPDIEARSNSVPAELTGVSSFAFPTKVINPLGHTSYTQFDYYLGQPVNGEDANGVISSGSFNDQLDRPTQVRRAAGTTKENQTTFAYDDTNRTVTTSTDRDTLGDNVFVGKILYDQIGRIIQSQRYEGGSNYIVVETQYDALGRAYKTSYPYRPWQSQTAVWTTQAFDALGRVTSVTTPDNAAVIKSYSGNTVTFTDQAGKMRKSVTDALGRLTDVYEDPNGVNYQTSYLYDVLDNLVKVTQGSQQRFFMYDSLKRLIRARNPEQNTLASLNLSDSVTSNSAWSTAFQYDAGGNLTQKTDARGVVSAYTYDALNRNTTVDYSDTASINPDVTRFYDGAIKGIGRFWYFYRGGDFSAGSTVEATAIDNYDALGRPLVKRQISKLNGTWSTTYQTSRTYNLAGGVTSQTYPSGHTVTYTYDAAGRTSSFSGYLGDGVNRTYATNISYSPFGGLTREQFGTNTPLYHKSFYNIRGQLFDTRVSSVNDMWDWNRGRLILYYSGNHVWGQSGTDNNGNVRFAETWIPPENATLDQPDTLIEDSYNYDALNRLSSVAEQRTSVATGWGNWQQQFRQQYGYDRWGNRTIDAAQTWGTGCNNKQFTVDTATNRLGVPAGQTGVMTYDNAGNLTTDTYTGTGSRTYDANNLMTTAADNMNQISRYTYDADGRRVRRQIASSQEEWHVYGIDGELIAEYHAGAPASAPKKEYGYRDGQLLITASGRFNVALAANGAVASASSAQCCFFPTTGAINGNYRGPWGNGEGWNDNTPNSVPDWIQVDFAGSKTIDEIDVFSLHDNYMQENTPTETQTFTLYGLLAFDVQYWNGSSWTTLPGGSVTGNNKIWRKFTFSPITTSKIRVFINQVPDSWSRVVEIQAFGTSAGGEKVQWLVPDHLGTPRIIVDQTGSLVNVKRHDYLPFGEELFAPAGGRTTAQGYRGNDGVRQQFTQQERDSETGLDYFHARYFSAPQGRFTSTDALLSAKLYVPQSWNRYSYVLNNPTRLVDPTGMTDQDPTKPKPTTGGLTLPNPCNIGTPGCGAPLITTVDVPSGPDLTPVSTTDVQPITELQVMTGQENPLPQDGAFMRAMDFIFGGFIGGAGAASASSVAVGTAEGSNPAGIGVAAGIGGILTGALLYDLSRTITDAVPIPNPRTSNRITVFHYTTAPPSAFVIGLLPGSSATDHPALTAESASVGLGIPPPTLVYPVTFDPQTTPYYTSGVRENKYGAGGLNQYYFPNGTPPGSVGPPRPVPSFAGP
jgi:RHS repeat-associated protein